MAEAAEHKPVVLLAEDDASTRDLIEIILLSKNYTVVSTGDGKEALEYLKQSTPDLAIFDISMPHLRGPDLADRMRRTGRLKDVPIVILSAHRDDRSRAEASMSRVNAYLTKPFSKREFVDTVEALLKTQTPPRENQVPAADLPAPPTGTIMVIEDNQAIRRLIEDVLSAQGYQVRSAQDQQQALKLLERRLANTNLILLDLTLPDGDGFSLLRTIRERSAVPVLILSAQTDPETLETGRELGAQAHIAKPFSPRALLSAVTQHLHTER